MFEPNHIAAVVAAFAEMPTRFAALERSVTELTAKMEALRVALPPLLVRVPEAAAVCKVSAKTVRRWVETRQIPAVRIGRMVRIDLTRVHGIDADDVAMMSREARDGR
jgi:excisionase family DNA binding protein